MGEKLISTTAVLLAAGQGTRMKSSHPKVLHQILGRPMIAYLIDTLKSIGVADILVVVGYQAEKVMAALAEEGVRFVIQEPQQGTGHAVQVAMEAVPPEAETVMVLCGDVPLISGDSVAALYRLHQETGAAVTVQTVELPDGAHYGRVVRDDQGRVLDVVQSKDAKDSPESWPSGRSTPGPIASTRPSCARPWRELEVSPVTGEIYLTDMIMLARKHGRGVEALIDPDWPDLLGINSRKELAQAVQTLKRRINDLHLAAGVTLMDPDSTYIGPQVIIGRDTVIYPNVYLEGSTVIGADCLIEPNVKITDSALADNVYVKMGSVIAESSLAAGVQVGPYSHLRPLSDLREGARVGNFVEVKKSILYPGVKANHLTYLGDAEVGAGANVGAGTITCNYDGVHKHKTIIGEKAFIGSNTALVAPVTVGPGAYVGAGSTITKDVPPGMLGIARARQVVLKRPPGMGKKKVEATPLNAGTLALELEKLGLDCPPEVIQELVGLFAHQGIATLEAFAEVAHPDNLELIRQMFVIDGEKPSIMIWPPAWPAWRPPSGKASRDLILIFHEVSMCGIIGYLGPQEAMPILLDGLKRLEYRGYDSAGMAVIGPGGLAIRRSLGKLRELEKALAQDPLVGSVGIGHTRWATHGRPSEANAHPHQVGEIAVVHNGIIENYLDIKENLLKEGHRFASETDTEIVSHLVVRNLGRGVDYLGAVRLTLQEIRGSYALAMVNAREPRLLVAARKESPLILGLGEGEFFLASDIPAILPYTRRVIFLEDHDLVVLRDDDFLLLDGGGHQVERQVHTITWSPAMAEKAGYKHFMQKEIFEQPRALIDTFRSRIRQEQGEVVLEEVPFTQEDLEAIRKIFIVACGTSFHAAMVGKHLLEGLCRVPVEVDLGSEFRYRDPLMDQNSC
jgi:UDP-N-acetylglucosamine diphosphorylase/glucosamine-1-phosphate N-acetyltransferase